MAIIFILGEIISLIIALYIDYFGTPKKLFREYGYDGDIKLYMIAFLGGWIIFPFFIYVLYKQIKLNENRKDD